MKKEKKQQIKGYYLRAKRSIKSRLVVSDFCFPFNFAYFKLIRFEITIPALDFSYLQAVIRMSRTARIY
jgi:hypothetical protein